jgi:hypothetical protein
MGHAAMATKYKDGVRIVPKPREPNGNIQRPTTLQARADARHAKKREDEAAVIAIGIAQPHRRGRKDPRSPLHGHALGRLYGNGWLTQSQYTALQWALRVTLRYDLHVADCPPPRFPSALAREIVDNMDGPVGGNELSDHELGAIRSAMRQVNEALSTGWDLVFHEAKAAIYRVGVLDRDADRRELGVLRLAANRLHKAMSAQR